MSGERPVPVGNFNRDRFTSDRNQYLETGELNGRDRGYGHYNAYQEPPYSMYNPPPPPPPRGYQTLPNTKQGSSQQLKAYLQDFCVRDPVRYREWYRQYKAHKENPHLFREPRVPGYPPNYGYQQQLPYIPPHQYHQQHVDRRTPLDTSYRRPRNQNHYDDDDGRDKVPSGRSSVNGSLFGNLSMVDDSRYTGLPAFDTESTTGTSPDRLTPQKFTIGHSIGVITPFGHLLRVSGGSRTVEIVHVKSLMKDLPEYHELESFPGPLIRDRTHKNTVIKFCQKKIKALQNHESPYDKENLVLLWEFLILLIRQNGSVVGSDIAELLLKKKGKIELDFKPNSSDGEDEGDDGDGDSGVSSTVLPINPNDFKITQGFCDLLLFGHKNDALEFAMGKGLWGHALFLASKMGDREYGQVMTRFANGLAYNHPLQTLYQIMSGRVPSAVTGCLDDSFGDWRPHLAMIISNSGSRPEVEQKAFSTLGDTLRNKNLVFGGQFCHLMGQSAFAEESKLGPLLGLFPDRANLLEATQMTEVYEFATSLAEPKFSLGLNFLRSKFNYVKNLIDFGFTAQAFAYCEVIAKALDRKDDNLRWDLLQVAERLRYSDNGRMDGGNGGQDWIQDLRLALTDLKISDSESSSRRGSSTGVSSTQEPETSTSNEFQPGNIQPFAGFNSGVIGGAQTETNGPFYLPSQQAHSEESQQPAFFNPAAIPFTNTSGGSNSNWYNTVPLNGTGEGKDSFQIQTQQLPQNQLEESQPPNFFQTVTQNPYENSWQTENSGLYYTQPPQQQQQQQPFHEQSGPPPNSFQPIPKHDEKVNNNDINFPSATGSGGIYGYNNPTHIGNGPMVDSHYQTSNQPVFLKPKAHSQPTNQNPVSKNSDENEGGKSKDDKKSSKKSNSAPGSGRWLTGWLPFRSKNQMILPDDKDPTIVWDESTKEWINTKEAKDETSAAKGPPPRDSELNRSLAPPPLQHPQQITYGPPQMNYPSPSTVPDGPPTFNPQLQQPITKKENWGPQVQSSPSSLNFQQNLNQPPFQPSTGPQSLNLSSQQTKQLNSPQQPPSFTPMNKYKLPKSGRGGMRGKYVDVLNPGGVSSGTQPMTLVPPGMGPMGNGSMFVPSPSTESEDFPQ